MSDTVYMIGFGLLLFGLLYALFMIDYLYVRLNNLKENLDFARHRIAFLERLHMREVDDEGLGEVE